jgi:pimeloyl-ACP methyl ester carboxylesterase
MSHLRYVYLHGFASGPQSSKGRFFRERFHDLGLELELPDLTEGDFEHSTLGRQVAVVDRLLGGDRAVLLGSSMGGYLAALFAARHPEQVDRVALLAPAFGLARLWGEQLGEATMREWREQGWRNVLHYGFGEERAISYELIEDGLRHEDFPDVRQPALVLHGRRDETVDCRLSEQFAAGRANVRLVLYDSDHQLLDVLEPMWGEVRSFLA